MGFNLADYEQVKDRISRFYADHQDGAIHTELVTPATELAKCAGFKAYCYVGNVLKSTGYAFESQGQGVNKDAWVENAETSAIGRALANMDYCGSVRPSREEMSKVSNKPVESKTANPKKVEVGLQVKAILEDKCFTDSDIEALRKDFVTCDDKDLDGFLATVKHLKSVKSVIPSEIVK